MCSSEYSSNSVIVRSEVFASRIFRNASWSSKSSIFSYIFIYNFRCLWTLFTWICFSCVVSARRYRFFVLADDLAGNKKLKFSPRTQFSYLAKMQTEQELLNEIARVAGLINRKKQEQTRSTSTSKEITQPPVVPLKTGRNLSYVRPGAEKPHTTQISSANPRKSAPKIPTNLANTNIATTPNVQNNSKPIYFFAAFS